MYKYNENFFEKIDSPRKAYWLGFLYADGCILDQRKSKILEITLSKNDKNHLQKFLDDLESDVPIKTKKVKLGNKEYEACRIFICSTYLCDCLIELGCAPRKSLTLEFPKNKIPDNLINYFILGYFDGDGCFSPREDTNTASLSFVGTYDFLIGILNVFKDKGLVNKYTKIYKKGNAYHFFLYNKANIKRILFYLYGNKEIYLERKYVKIKEFYKNHKTHQRGVYFDKRLKKWIACITINKKRNIIGKFEDEESAIQARIEKEIELFKNAEIK